MPGTQLLLKLPQKIFQNSVFTNAIAGILSSCAAKRAIEDGLCGLGIATTFDSRNAANA